MNPLALLDRFRAVQTTGIDFGASHFKLIELARQQEGYRITSIGMAEAGLADGEDAAIRRVRVFLREHGVKPGKAAININDETLRIRRMELAKMPDRDLKTAIRWNFRESVDVPIEKYVVSYTSIPEKSTDEKVPFMAYGVAADAVTRCQTRCKKIGFRATNIEPNVTALLAAFDNSVGLKKGERVALVDLGFSEGLFLVLGGEALLFSRPLAGVNGARLLRLLGKEGLVPEEEARATFKTLVGGEAVPESVSQIVDDFFTQMLVEIQRSIDGYAAIYKTEESLPKLYICGGGSALPNVTTHLTKNLGIQSEIFNPFMNIADAEGHMPANVDQAAIYAVAVGLALPVRQKQKEKESGPAG